MPDAMLASVARSALERSGAGDALLRELDGISIVESASWPVPDPGRMLGMLLRGPVEGKVKEFLTKGAAEGLKEYCES